MPTTVIDVLRQAVDADPTALDVRLHLASLLVLEGDATNALLHARVVLEARPDDIHALGLARDASRALGDTARAAAYERLLGIPADTAMKAPETGPLTSAGFDEADDEASFDPEHALGLERPKVTLADVGGMTAVKQRLDMAFLAPLRNPELREYYGKSLRGGLLLYGPPGCGKTFVARALAGELAATFISIGLSDVLDMYVGESERRLHELFELARRSAPCVLFLDEIDALGGKRTGRRESAGRNVINQLLAELDGVDDNNEGVFVLAATNHPWDVDTALRRPGRLDRTVLVLPPDHEARGEILRGALSGRPVDGVDERWLAKSTDGFSGADLAHLVEAASEHALEASIKSGTTRPIGKRDFQAALRDVHGSTAPWFSVAHGYATYANQTGQYDDLLAYVRANKLL